MAYPLLLLAIGMKKWEVVFIKLKIAFERLPEMKWLLYIEIVLHLFIQCERQKNDANMKQCVISAK